MGERVSFVEPYAPTEDEMRRWAECDGSWPNQDWDVLIVDTVPTTLIMEIVDDGQRYCWNARCLMASVLYLFSGLSCEGKRHPDDMAELTRLVGIARRYPRGPLTVWADRTEELMADPSLFDYRWWCEGGLAAVDMGTRAP